MTTESNAPDEENKPNANTSDDAKIRRLHKELDEIRNILKVDLADKPLDFDREVRYHKLNANLCLGAAAAIIITGIICFWKADKITSSWSSGIENYVQHSLDSLAKNDTLKLNLRK